MRHFTSLARRLLSRFNTKKTSGVPNVLRFRPRLEVCEDRTVPTPVVTVQALADATEGGAAGLIRFTRTETSGSLYVSLMASGTATAGSDYTSVSGVRFADGEATVDLNVTATDDSAQEATETLTYTIVPFYIYTVGTPGSATINLYDNDTPPAVTVERISDATEGGATGKFRFTRTGNVSQAITVNVSPSGTATLTLDYTGLPNQVQFAAGHASVDVDISAIRDGRVEPNETVTVTINGGNGYTVGATNSATLTVASQPWLVNTLGDGMDVNLGDSTPADANGNASLRAALMQANANAIGGGVGGSRWEIAFDPALFIGPGGAQQPATITITNGPLPTFDTWINLIGPGKTLLSVSGNHTTRVFQIGADSVSSITDLTIRDGSAPADGGGIENLGVLTLERVNVLNNTAVDGGGILNNKLLTIRDSEITHNHAVRVANNNNGYGGGILTEINGDTFIVNSFVAHNSATLRGGGIAIRNTGKVTVSGTAIQNNTANAGAGVYNSGGTFNMSMGAILWNVASTDGGGIQTGGTTSLSNVTIWQNVASGSGGGIWHQTGTLTVDGGTIEDNRALNGGGVYQEGGTATYQNLTVKENKATEWGGGFHVVGGNLTFTTVTFSLNQATLGGAKIAKKNAPAITIAPDCIGLLYTDIEVDPR
jgi:hypothetical protein